MKRPSCTLFLLICLTGLMSSGCLRFSRKTDQVVRPVPEELAKPFAYTRISSFKAKETEVESTHKYTVRRIEFEVPSFTGDSNRLMVLTHYHPNGPAPSPVILILPISGGSYDLEEYFSRYFAKKGLATIIVHREKISKSAKLIENINDLLVQTVIDNQHVIDWVETRPELDANRIGVFGTSMGGIKGSLLAPVEPRVKAAVLGLAGGDIPYVLEQSTEPGIRRRRKQLLEETGYSIPELRSKLEEIIVADPLNYGPYVDNEKVMLVLAACDTVVPFPKGWELREAMGRPETVVVFAGHYSALIYLPYIQSRAWHFFQRRFGLNH